MNNQQLIESLDYHLYKVNEDLDIPVGDEEVLKHPIALKLAKEAKKHGGLLTSEQSTSLIALAILVKYKDESGFTKEMAMKTFKSELPGWFIKTGLLGTILNFVVGNNSIPLLIAAFLVNGLLWGPLATILSALMTKNSASAYYTWAKKWALDHDWVGKDGELKSK